MHVGIAQNPMHVAQPPALPRTPHVNLVVKLVTGMPDAEPPPVDRTIQTRSQPDVDPMVENKSRPIVLMWAMTMIPNVTGASSNVMPLCIFAKLLPCHITTDGKPTRLCLYDTRLIVYNGSNIPQLEP